jgi:hypothetical protein
LGDGTWEKGTEMAEAVVNLVFLGIVFLALILCLIAPIAALGYILWHWHKESTELSRSRKVA